jgi:hypothetical protein
MIDDCCDSTFSVTCKNAARETAAESSEEDEAKAMEELCGENGSDNHERK